MNQIYLGNEKKVYLCEYLCENSKKSLIILSNIGWYHTGPNRMFPNLANYVMTNRSMYFVLITLDQVKVMEHMKI